MAFDLADKYRNPVMVLADGMIGQLMEPVELSPYHPMAGLPPKDWATTGTSRSGGRRRIINSLYLAALYWVQGAVSDELGSPYYISMVRTNLGPIRTDVLKLV